MHEFFSFKTEFFLGARRKHMVEICGCSAALSPSRRPRDRATRSRERPWGELWLRAKAGPKLSEVPTHFGPPVPCRNLVKHQRILGIPQISLKRPRRALKRPRRVSSALDVLSSALDVLSSPLDVLSSALDVMTKNRRSQLSFGGAKARTAHLGVATVLPRNANQANQTPPTSRCGHDVRDHI